MGDQLRVDVDQFRSFVPRFAQLKDQTEAARTTLTAGLDSEGECWGADETGSSFASKYVTPSRETIDAISSLVQLFAILGGKVGAVADNFQQADTAYKDSINSNDLGGG